MERFEFGFFPGQMDDTTRRAHHAEGWCVLFKTLAIEAIEDKAIGAARLSEEEINDLEGALAALFHWREIGDDTGHIWYRQVDEDGLPY
jgi:hypothetical protein